MCMRAALAACSARNEAANLPTSYSCVELRWFGAIPIVLEVEEYMQGGNEHNILILINTTSTITPPPIP